MRWGWCVPPWFVQAGGGPVSHTRQDSNLEPVVLETTALPVELRALEPPPKCASLRGVGGACVAPCCSRGKGHASREHATASTSVGVTLTGQQKPHQPRVEWWGAVDGSRDKPATASRVTHASQ